jgi:hypothetical protein
MLETNANQVTGFNASRLKMSRELVRAAIKLRITNLIVSKASSDRIRFSFRTSFK